MRAIVVPEYGDPSVLTVADRPVPEPGPEAVRIDVAGAGVNFADLEQRRGRYRDGPEPPFVPGLEVAGTVDAVGDDVEEWAVGDEVAALLADGGGYAEYAVADREFVFPRPPETSATAAGGALIQGFTAHNVVHEWGDLAAGETALVTAAAGGVGSVAVQLAAAAGAEVIAAASTAEKRAFARDRGADHAVDYATEDLADAVERITDGSGIDLLVDGVGGEAFGAGVEALSAGGRAVTYGVASGDVPTVATPRLFYRNRSVVGYHLLSGLRDLPERVLAAREPLWTALEEGDASVTVEATRDLADAAAVHRAVADRATRGRVVLTP